MAEFYDEIFDVGHVVDFDVDVIYPDGSKDEMYLIKMPKVGEMLRGYIISKVILNKNPKENELDARIELKRKEKT